MDLIQEYINNIHEMEMTLDDYGDKLAKGTYLYRLRVKNQENQTAEVVEKLVIL